VAATVVRQASREKEAIDAVTVGHGQRAHDRRLVLAAIDRHQGPATGKD
jgi:hypothetical protein